MITEVVPDIYRITFDLSGPMGSVHSYLVAGEDRCLLVDTGPSNAQTVELVTDAIRESGLDPEADPLETVLLTHAHPDHAGGVAPLRERFDLEVYLHPFEELFHGRGIDETPFFVSGVTQWLRIHGVPDSERDTMVRTFEDVIAYDVPAVDRKLEATSEIAIGRFDWDVRWTPGHTPGHVVLYEPTAGLLLSGDHLLPDETPNVGLNPRQPQNPLADYLDSLAETTAIDPDRVFPAHGDPMAEVDSRVAEIRAHHDERLASMERLLEDEPRTSWEVACGVDWSPGAFDSLNRYGKFSALCETMSHLECLRSNGAVAKGFATGAVKYTPTT